jgi:hypothetical protein
VQHVIASVPPHWNEGLVDDFGSRWAGQVKCMYVCMFVRMYEVIRTISVSMYTRDFLVNKSMCMRC